jgi:hypothetical protein
MRQRVIKVLAAFVITAAGVAVTAVAASAEGQDGQLVPVGHTTVTVVQPDSIGWE